MAMGQGWRVNYIMFCLRINQAREIQMETMPGLHLQE